MAKVITFGEIMLRLSTNGYQRFVQSDNFDVVYGGGEANVAVSLANYGHDAYFVTKLPAHEIGQCAVDSLRRYGVNVDFIARGGDRVGIYFLETGASMRPSKVIYDRAHSSVSECVPEDFDFDEIFKDATWFHWTGITPALGKNTQKVLKQALICAKKHGVTVSCDLNYRKKLWTPAEAQECMTDLMQYVDVCIGNEEDAEKCLGFKPGETDVTTGDLQLGGYKQIFEQMKEKFGFKDMVCNDCHVCACYADGLPERPIEQITLQNVRFNYAKDAAEGYPSMKNNNLLLKRAGLRFFNVNRVVLNDVVVDGCSGEQVVSENVGEVTSYDAIKRYVDRLVRESTPQKPFWNVEHAQNKAVKWNYIDGCMLTALLELGKISGDKKYFDFVEKFADYYVAEDGTPLQYDKNNYNLDDINEGRVLFELFEKTGKEKYQKAIALLKTQLDEQPRTVCGNFWHKKIYPNQIWLDGIYMAQVFSAMWHKRNDGNVLDVIKQIENVRDLMKDPGTGLFYHGCDCSKQAFWCDKQTGLSANFWLRSIGWFLVALADLCEVCAGDTQAKTLHSVLKDALTAVSHFVDDKTKMLYQVPNCIGKEGNYPETSGSAMVAYAMLKGARLGIVGKRFATLGAEIFDGICKQYLTERDGQLNLGGICLVAGLGPESNRRRDGSFQYYVSEPIVENDAKGVAPLVLCYTEIVRL